MLERIIKKTNIRNLLVGSIVTFNITSCSNYGLDPSDSSLSSKNYDTSWKDPEIKIDYSNSIPKKYDCEIKEKWFKDTDKDQFGDPNNIHEVCPGYQDEDDVPNDKDCDDTNYNVNPKAKEICNNIDDNCNGKTDENLDKACKTVCGNGLEKCIEGKYQACSAGLPSEEICDGLDNNCNGATDENLKFEVYFQDNDGDDYGSAVTKIFCKQPKGWTKQKGDCDDTNEAINPAAEEICDGIDNDCDGLIDKLIESTKCNTYDFIFVIDNSGSMKDSDPGNYRYSGLKALVSLWQVDDYGLFIPFATYSQVIDDFRNSIPDLVKNIETAQKASVGYGTNIGEAVQKAFNQFKPNKQKKAIILLTDGDTGDASNYSPSFLNGTAKQKNIQICALGLGAANANYLTTLTQGIGGYLKVSKDIDIPNTFQKNYLSLKCQTFKECNPQKQWISNSNPCGKN